MDKTGFVLEKYSSVLWGNSVGDFEKLIHHSLFLSGAISGVVVAAIFLTRSFWTKPRPPLSKPGPHSPFTRHGLLIVSLATIATAYLGFPRLSHSLWTDEQVALRKSIVGEFVHDPEIDGLEDSLFKVYWEETEWPHTLWFYENPNPHFLLDIAARISNRVWHWSTDRAEWEFSELALRLPAFICGLLAIPAWFLFIHRLGFPRVAALSAAVLALHPWFIRSITEARGYPLALFLIPFWLTAILSVENTDRWKHWWLLGISQILLLYSWPGMIALVVATNVTLFLLAKHIHLNRRRWGLANILAALFLFILTAPCFAQIGGYIKEDALSLPVGLIWFKDLTTRFLLGIDWHDHFQYSHENAAYRNFDSSAVVTKLAMGALFLIAMASLTKGIHLWWKNSPLSRILIIATFASFLIIYIPAAILGIFLFQSYLLFLLPFVIALCATGFLSLVEKLRHHSRLKLAAISSAFALFAFCTLPVTAALRSTPLDPLREAARTVRGTSDPLAPGQDRIITAYVGLSARAYDPLCWAIDSATSEKGDPWPGLTQLMKHADILDCELHVHLAFPQIADHRFPKIVRMLHTENLFEKTNTLLGLEPQYKREIYRYKGGMFDWLK